MRDFRDAKGMAHTLRAALAARGFKITISQSLELIAEAFGVADWNTLAAAIRQEAPTGRDSTSRPQQATAGWASSPSFSSSDPPCDASSRRHSLQIFSLRHARST